MNNLNKIDLKQPLSQLPNLNSLRFFLALFVILYHLPQFCENRGFPFFDDWAIFHKGTEAVYVFFSLSGFLIIRQLYDEKRKTNHVNLKRFYLNRILRIFPLYYLVLIFGILYYAVILPQLGMLDAHDFPIKESLLFGFTFLANVLETYKPGGILEILWSISIEEQFYILIAPVFLLIKNKRILTFLITFSIVYFFFYNFTGLEWLRKFKMLYYYFSVSGIIAILSLKFPDFKLPKIIGFSILMLFILYFFTPLFEGLSDALYQLISMILFPMVIWILSQKSIPVFDSKILNHLGKISYGIYMYHAIAMQIVGFIFLKIIDFRMINDVIFIPIFYGTVILFTIIMSHFSYHYFEKYFLKMKKSYLKSQS